MPHLVSQILTPEEWISTNPRTPVQQFFHKYHEIVDAGAFNNGSGAQFYADDMTFHNQNNATYTGKQMWPWMQAMFGQFEDLKHKILSYTEVGQDDGSSYVYIQFTRMVWGKGNKSDTPDASIPVFWRCIIGPSSDSRAFNGLQYKEVWIYWDTMLLAPIMPEGSVVFSTKNVIGK